MIKAIVFDFDGLIIDTESVWYDVMVEIFNEHGHELPFELWAKCVGTGDDELYAYLERNVNKPIVRKEVQQAALDKHKIIMANRKIRPGVEAYLQAAKEQGLKIGLASSSTRTWVEGFLKKFGLYEYFECIRTSDDVKNVKPDPELYIKACECLGVAPHEAIAFEDSPNGTRAAKAAGMQCVIVPNDVTSKMTFDEYDHRMAEMTEIAFEELLEQIKEKWDNRK